MTPVLSPNTQAILLLTAPLITGRGTPSSDLLSLGEYKRLARHLLEMQRQPADLLSSNAAEMLRACQPVIEESRLQRLLSRGFLLSQVIERWQSRAIWVVSRADADYPRRLKTRLKSDSPAVLYGCGNIGLLAAGGLAVVGSRHVDDNLIDYAKAVGQLSARAGRMILSGGAKGIDQAAMRGALEASGTVCGVLADNLEKTVLNRENRNWLIDDQLVLISPYDPSAGFNVGHAMQRNKLIYALADAALVVSSDLNKGGTWAGATEQLDKLKLVPVYVRSTEENSAGMDALRRKGALHWPNPQDADAFEAALNVTTPIARSEAFLPLVSETPQGPHQERVVGESLSTAPEPEVSPADANRVVQTEISPAEALFATAREVTERLLTAPMKDADVAAALEVSTAQAKIWLQRLVEEGVLVKLNKPVRYVTKLQTSLLLSNNVNHNHIQQNGVLPRH